MVNSGLLIRCSIHTNSKALYQNLSYLYLNAQIGFNIMKPLEFLLCQSLLLNEYKLLFHPFQSKQRLHTYSAYMDERIATHKKIIEDLKLLRGAIMVEHYHKCNKICKRISDLGEAFNVMNLAKDDLSDNGEPCIIYGELFTTYDCIIREVVSHTTSATKVTRSCTGDLLFPASTTVDAVSLISPSAIQQSGVILGGDMFGIHIKNDYNSSCLSYYFNIIGKKSLAKYAKGSTIIHLHYVDIQNHSIFIPPKEG